MAEADEKAQARQVENDLVKDVEIAEQQLGVEEQLENIAVKSG